jgi:glycosyltransferase involved in cell wall biosynthesis
MATIPYFFIGPNALLSIIGLVKGPDVTIATPTEDWREAKVDVVIPAFNEEKGIVLCLESLASQTIRPNKIILIDDGSTDQTVRYAEDFCEMNDLEIEIISRKSSIGKTPTLKRQAREMAGDVEFILDADTVLISNNYLARVVEELYQGVGTACACGTVLPLREKDAKAMIPMPRIQKFLEKYPDAHLNANRNFVDRILHGITNVYRDVLYFFLQQFVFHGQMIFFGTMVNPVGCAVAYRRKYLKDVFDRYEPILGDDLTTSEDIFIGFALLEQGYRNIQVRDVFARSEEPEAQKVPRQIFLWSSSFLQSCYYFPSLLFSPFKQIKQWFTAKKSSSASPGKELRKIKEPYRQPFGIEYTRQNGRPIGWAIFVSAVEKVTFPCVVILMAVFQMWEPLIITMVAETALQLFMALAFATGRRVEYFFKALAITPLRYCVLIFDIITIMKFLIDVLIRKNTKWRK